MARSLVLVLVLVATAAAQDNSLSNHTDRLRKAVTAALDLSSVAFATDVRKPEAAQGAGNRLVVRLNGLASRDPDGVEGVWTPDTLYVRKDDHELVERGRRMIARQGDGDWVLRDGRLADGAPAPMVIDPGRLLRLIEFMNIGVRHQEVGTVDDRPVELHTVSFDPGQSKELVLAGLVPDAPSTNPGMVVLRAAGGAVAGVPPDTVVDAVFVLDPATRHLREIRFRAIADQAPGAARIRVVGGGIQVEEPEEEEEEEIDETHPRYEDGFPVRSTADKSVVHWKITFSDHDEAGIPELDERGEHLLR